MPLDNLSLVDFKIADLGTPKIDFSFKAIKKNKYHIEETNRILYHSHAGEIAPYLKTKKELPSFELAGPRARLFFAPEKTKLGIVTCGGLCPGLNTIIRAIVYTAYNFYGVTEVYGYRYGYEGLNPAFGHEPLKLTPDQVDYITDIGGTILGSSRGPQEAKVMVDYLVREKINILFTVGGDGTLRGAKDLAAEIRKRKLNIAIVGIPKTIDNDISFTDRSFGFETAVEEARKVIYSAHAEAKGAPNGVGLVKLMGRESGFIAAVSTLAAPVVNFCLIPEITFDVKKFLPVLEKRLAKKGHAVIVVAEGAGQDLVNTKPIKKDASGNQLLQDIGLFLKDRIQDHFKTIKQTLNIKYIDPSYIIRSVPPTADDNAFCLMLGQNAVHAGMAGKTDLLVGSWNSHYVHIPINLAISERKKVNPTGRLWTTVLETTGQTGF